MAEQDPEGGSTQPAHRAAFSETTWDRIRMKQSLGASRVVKISSNPFLTTAEARMLCAEGNLHANF